MADGVDYFFHKSLDLLWCPAHVSGGVQDRSQVNSGERRLGRQTLEQIVGLSQFFHLFGGCLGMAADDLVKCLAIAPATDTGHQDFLGCHERKFRFDRGLYRLWIDHKTPGHAARDEQAAIGCQEGLGDAQAFVRGIVQGSFEPLLCRGLQGGGDQANDEAG